MLINRCIFTDNRVIANLKQLAVILKKIGEAMMTPQALSRQVCMTSHKLVCAIGGGL